MLVTHPRGIPATALLVLLTFLLAPRPAFPAGLDTIRLNIFDSVVLEDGTLLLVGDHGKIHISRDRGRAWTDSPSGTRKPLFSVTFPDGRHGWISGKSGLILHTADGGATWSPQEGSTEKHLFSTFFIDALHGWAVGDWGAIIATEDGGRTWTDRSLDDDVVLYDVLFKDGLNGWVCGEFGGLYRTADGGVTWKKVEFRSASAAPSPPAEGSPAPGPDPLELFDRTLFALARSGERLVVVGMDGAILHSGTEGVTWAEAENPVSLSLYGVAIKGRTAWAVGDVGTVLRSDDGGVRWRPVDEVPAEKRLFWAGSVNLVGADQGLITGANGLLFFIRDGHLRLAAEGTAKNQPDRHREDHQEVRHAQ